MSGPATEPTAGDSPGDRLDDPVVERATVASLTAQFGSPDAEAGANARRELPASLGRLGRIARWLAETGGGWPAAVPARIRLLSVGAVSETTAALAAEHDVSTRGINVPTASDVDPTGDWFAAGVAAADAAVDEGVDVLIVSGQDPSGSAGVVVSLYTGAEPVTLLPRGASAVDTADWIARATFLRNHRRRVSPHRADPDALLAEVGSGPLAAAAGCIARATARRTPVLLDGTVAVTGALVCHEVQPRAARWWQVCDDTPDPAHRRVVEEFDLDPLLTLELDRDDGTGGVLCVPLMRAAAQLGRPVTDVSDD